MNSDATYATDAHSISFTDALFSCGRRSGAEQRSGCAIVGKPLGSTSQREEGRARGERRGGGARLEVLQVLLRGCEGVPRGDDPDLELERLRSKGVGGGAARLWRQRLRGRWESSSVAVLVCSEKNTARASLSFGASWHGSSYTPYLSYTGIWMCLSWWRAADPRYTSPTAPPWACRRGKGRRERARAGLREGTRGRSRGNRLEVAGDAWYGAEVWVGVRPRCHLEAAGGAGVDEDVWVERL